jgi:radical SAM-linked protein
MTKASKVRLRFAKCGDLRLLSHHDLMRCLERMLRRARVEIAMSQGFNPRPKMVFALALGLGIEGHREVVDLELSTEVEPCALLARLQAVAPPGFNWTEAQALPARAAAPHPVSVEYSIPVPAERRGAAQSALETLLATASWPLVRTSGHGSLPLDLRRQLLESELAIEGFLRFRLQVSPDGSIRPLELLEALGLSDLTDGGAVLCRTDVDLGG